MSAPRLLVIEGNTEAGRARAAPSGGRVASEAYADLLRGLAPPGTVVDICYPADPGANLPGQGGLESYDGIAITGSALNIYDGGPAIEPQIDLVRAGLKSGTPMFGSCWGLQVAAVAAGGTVHAHPKGREIGFARAIRRTAAGRGHKLFDGKPDVFGAICVHLDEVAVLPPGASVLAANDWSAVQAMEIVDGGARFWGVQYHPEYDFAEIAAVFRRYGQALYDQGILAGPEDKAAFVDDLMALQANPDDARLGWRYGLDGGITNDSLRHAELANWLTHLVMPVRSERGRGRA
jgi:GMP synthase (glutamine-hydrolysing)